MPYKDKEQKKEYDKKRYELNKNQHKIVMKDYYEKNKEKLLNDHKTYHELNKDKWKNYKKGNLDVKRRKKYLTEYRKNNKEKINLNLRNRFINDSKFRLICNLRSLISGSIRTKGYKKVSKSNKILGCDFETFKLYIESQFEPWMNWDNYGNPKDGIFEINKTWDIDHIIPVNASNSESEIINLNHYTNLRPLCSYTNRWIKKDRY